MVFGHFGKVMLLCVYKVTAEYSCRYASFTQVYIGIATVEPTVSSQQAGIGFGYVCGGEAREVAMSADRIHDPRGGVEIELDAAWAEATGSRGPDK